MNKTITSHLKRLNIVVVILVQTVFFPLAAFAQTSESDVPPAETTQSVEATPEQQPNSTTETPIAPPEQQVAPTATQGPAKPPGPASNTYTKNPETGKWENDHYIWDPVTGQTTPKDQPTYSYNPTTGRWDTTQWYYNPASGKYEPNVVSVATNPNDPSTLLSAAGTGLGQQSVIDTTGPNSNNQIENGGTTTGTFDLFFDATISNKIGQMSQSGNATVQGNTLGGNALTGDATALANVLNMIQSSWGSLGSQDIAFFMSNINGDITGDLYVDPSALGSGSGNTDIDVNVSTNAAIDNDIDVTVASGDALVNGNTTGGDATSGDAHAVVNLLNLINSAITANKSFVGVLNINGNLNGDILLPPDMIKAIIAATGPNSNNQIQNNNTVNANLNVDTNTDINNAIHTDVGTGNASVTNNTTGGSATTGDATSNVVLLNLTGQQVVAKNALLVFVNVMGSWVGLILDAPAGTTAVAATGPGSNNTINSENNLTVDADITRNNLINNDVTVSAHSGDATVSNNTTGGDATTGDASVGVNVLNMVDSQFDVSDWFGVLFINVFGSWIGSFGVNTEAGNKPASVGVVPPAATTTAVTTPPSFQQPQTFRFVQRSDDSNTGTTTQGVVAGATDKATPPSVLQTASAAPAQTASVTNSNAASNSGMNLWIAGIITFVGALMLGGERLISILRSRPV